MSAVTVQASLLAQGHSVPLEAVERALHAAVPLPTGGLTPRQRAAQLAIQERVAATGCAPSLRELQQLLGLASHGQVAHLIGRLIARGYLRRRPFAHRGLEILRRVA